MRNVLASKKWLTMICLAAAFSLTTTACGDDDDNGSDNNTVADAGHDSTDDQDVDDGDQDVDDGDEDVDDGDEDVDDGDEDVDDGDEDVDDGDEDVIDEGDTVDEGDTGDEGDVDEATCDINGFTVVEEEALRSEGATPTLKVYAYTTADLAFPLDRLRLELYGSDGGATAAGVYQLDDSNYATCANCFLIDSTDADGNIVATYISQSGELNIANYGAVGEQFVATITDAELIQVEYDETDGLTTTPIADGANYCIDEISFDITLAAFGGTDPDPDPEVPVFEAPECSVNGTDDGFVVDSVSYAAAQSSGLVAIIAETATDTTTNLNDNLIVQLYGNTIYSPYPDGPAPYVEGTAYPVDDVNPQTCTNCVVIYEDCDADSGVCAKQYAAGAGELTFTTLDTSTGDFTATLTGAEFVEAIISPDDGSIVIVEDGAGWCIDSTTFSGTMLLAPTSQDFTDLVCEASGVEAGFVSTVSEASFITTSVLKVVDSTSTTFPRDQLKLELWKEFFDDTFTYEAGQTYPIDIFEYADCETCLQIDTNCDDTGACEDTYLAGAGSLEITEIDLAAGTLKATVTGVKFINAEDKLSGWCVDSYEFDAQVPAP